MNVRKVLAFSAAALALPLAAPALAQSTLHVGATVTDPQGGTVGTITAINGPTLTLHTDRHDIPLPVTSFTATPTTVLFGMTQAALDAAFDQAAAAAAAAAAALQVGAVLHDNTGAVVGPITELNAETATVSIGANVVRVPRGALQPGQGGVVINATLAELRAHSVPAPPPQPAPAPAPAPAATPSH